MADSSDDYKLDNDTYAHLPYRFAIQWQTTMKIWKEKRFKWKRDLLSFAKDTNQT